MSIRIPASPRLSNPIQSRSARTQRMAVSLPPCLLGPLVPLALVATVLAAMPEKPAGEEVAPPKFDRTSIYLAREIRGWHVLVHPALMHEKAELGQRALNHLDHQLYQVVHRLPAEAVAKLKQVKIWVELLARHHKCAVYHPD